MNPTEVRHAVSDCLAEFGEVQTWIAPTEYAQSFGGIDEINLSAKVIVGPVSPAAEEEVDRLFVEIPDKIDNDRTLGGRVEDVGVVTCTGHRLYRESPNEPTLIGAEWRLKVQPKEDE